MILFFLLAQLDGAELAAHGAALLPGAFAFLKKPPGFFRVERSRDLALPVEGLSGLGHFQVLLPGARHPLGDVGDVGRQFRRQDPFPDIFQGWKAKMLRRCDVTEEIGPGGPGDGAADGGGDVVVSRGDVRGQGPENIEGRPVAEVFLEPDVGLDVPKGTCPVLRS